MTIEEHTATAEPADEIALVAQMPNPGTSALLVVDMQKAFMADDSSLTAVGLSPEPLRAAIPGTLELVRIARQADVPRIFARYVYHPGMADFGLVRSKRSEQRVATSSLGFGTPEVELLDELEVRPDEFVIDKSRPSAFYGTRLEPLLHGLGIHHLVVCGVTTNICVESTVRDASQRDYNTFVVEDAVAEYEPDRHHNALKAIRWTFGTVLSVADVKQAWRV